MWPRLSSVYLSVYVWARLSAARSPQPSMFDWSTITPSSELRYHSCYDNFDCARLTVPRDWLDVDNNKTVAIAVIRLPATVSSDDPSFGGSIITNPGGPGGSGVDFIRGKYGRRLQQMTDGKKHYEFIGFDPRGVENTTPRAECFGTSHTLARDAMLLEIRGIGGMAATKTGLKRALALADGYGALCEEADADLDILSYVSTASVARDIVELADRIEDLRESDERATFGEESQSPIRQSSETKPSRVLYWGFSYGTALGNTLASMYPGRMGRVILDGVVDILDYMTDSFTKNLWDTEKIVQYFYDTCFEAADGCPLWEEGDTSGEDIQARIEELISDVDANPATFLANEEASSIRVITGVDIRMAFREPVYGPFPTKFNKLATALAAALKGNYSLIGPDTYPSVPLQDACGLNSHSPGDASAAIRCGDAVHFNEHVQKPYPRGANFSYWEHYIHQVTDDSPTLGPFWAKIATSGAGWRVKPKWGFTGPWVTPPADPSLKQDAPAAPILFTSSTLDPVTPLANAFEMSKAHPGASVLVLDTVGHCAAGNGWSECFNKDIRAYLDDGILPEKGKVCADTACKPFVKGGECEAPVPFPRAGVDAHGNVRSSWAPSPFGIPF